jgi:2,4-diaminopentanoate dehydrogenase
MTINEEITMARYKVIQWATGYTGIFALKYILLNPALELVGLKVFSADKAGKDAGELCGLPPVGVTATTSLEDILAMDADCVVYTPGFYDMQDPAVPGSNTHEIFQTLLTLLENGKNVATTVCPLIETTHYAGGAKVREQIEAACKKGGTTFFGTGFEPGFMADVLPLTLASTCGVVDSFTATECLDYSDYYTAALETLQAMGFGCKPESLGDLGPEPILLTWGSVPHMAARGLGVKLDDIKVDVDICLAPETFHIGANAVEKGTIAAMLFRLTGIVGGQPKIVLQHVNRLRDDMAPDWPRVDPSGGYRIEIAGTNPVRADFQLGLPGSEGNSFTDAMAMTAARCVNSVEAVVQGDIGFKTFYDLPPLTGKYTMHDA